MKESGTQPTLPVCHRSVLCPPRGANRERERERARARAREREILTRRWIPLHHTRSNMVVVFAALRRGILSPFWRPYAGHESNKLTFKLRRRPVRRFAGFCVAFETRLGCCQALTRLGLGRYARARAHTHTHNLKHSRTYTHTEREGGVDARRRRLAGIVTVATSYRVDRGRCS